MPIKTKKLGFEPTDEQQAVFDFVKDREENLIVEALAGTGKTTTQEHALRKVDKKVKAGAMAFNRSIGDELKKRLPSRMWAGTTHSWGFGLLRENYQGNLSMDKGKYFSAVRKLMVKDVRGRVNRVRLGMAVKVIRLVQASYPLFLQETMGNQELIVRQIGMNYGIEIDGETCRYVREALKIGLDEFSRNGIIDYSDMVWIPVANEFEIKSFDLLMVDEVQDLNVTQVMLCLKSGKRFVVVGDRKQQLYGFRGADVGVFDRLGSMLKPEVLPLTITQRCPRSVVDLAKVLVPEFRCREGASLGKISLEVWDEELPDILAPGDLVVCRVNAPLSPLLFRLWGRGKKAKIIGRDIGGQVLELLQRLVNRGDDCQDLIRRINGFEEKERERLDKEEASNAAKIQLQDNCDLLRSVAYRCDTVEQIETKLKEMFVEEAPNTAIRLSTIHRAKGLEANRVVLTYPDIIPHRMAQLDWELQQETNAAYVAVTRVKSDENYEGELMICGEIPPAFGG